jgi:gas vesicle protein
MSRNKWPETLIGFAVGISVGVALGIIFAPSSGEETREYLLTGAKDAFNKAAKSTQEFQRRAQDTIDDVRGRAQSKIDEARDYVQDAAEEGKKIFRQAKQG